MENMTAQIRSILEQTFSPHLLEIINESDKHSGHAHADAESHFFVKIHCSQFDGKSLVDQHRLVYKALKNFIPKPVHALRLETRASQ